MTTKRFVDNEPQLDICILTLMDRENKTGCYNLDFHVLDTGFKLLLMLIDNPSLH